MKLNAYMSENPVPDTPQSKIRKPNKTQKYFMENYELVQTRPTEIRNVIRDKKVISNSVRRGITCIEEKNKALFRVSGHAQDRSFHRERHQTRKSWKKRKTDFNVRKNNNHYIVKDIKPQ